MNYCIDKKIIEDLDTAVNDSSKMDLKEFEKQKMKKVLTSPMKDLTFNERNLKAHYEMDRMQTIYSHRNFVEKIGDYAFSGKTININESVSGLLGFYLKQGKLSYPEAQKVVDSEENYGVPMAVDCLECDILGIRDRGNMFFKKELE